MMLLIVTMYIAGPLDEPVQCDVQSTDTENNIQARLRVMWSKGQ